jgi:hypothetical protein
VRASRGHRSRDRRRGDSRPWWHAHSDAELLDLRISRLSLRIEGTLLARRLARLQRELDRAGLRFRPSVWLSTDWFSPDGVPGFAIPFFLAHERLTRIERRHMLEAEGGSDDWCMRLLRHETAHALDTAYRLHRRKSWRDHFGRASQPYTATYVPRPGSRRYVHNLDNYYAQSHPIEDFAETFAVWLRSRGRWRSEYRGWPALRKLEYVDALLREIAGRPQQVRSRERPYSLATIDITLREYYRRKQAHYEEDDLSVYDRDLTRLFGSGGRRKRASVFLRERRLALRREVARWTGQRPFVVDDVIRGMQRRCRELGLRLAHSERETGDGAAVLVTMHAARLERMRHVVYAR